MTGEPQAIRLLNLGPTQWLRTQSVYRSTAALMDGDSPDTIVMSTPLHGYAAVGGGHQPAAVLDVVACAGADTPIISSPLNAPVTVLDYGALVSQWVFYRGKPGEMAGLMLDGFAQALESLGLDRAVRHADRITVGEKILVAAQTGVIRATGVVQGDIFLTLDGRATTLIPDREAARTALWSAVPRPVSLDMLQAALMAAFANALGRAIERGTPTQDETRLSKQIDLELLQEAADLSGTEVIRDGGH